MSRSPPRASLRSGSRRCARSPCRCVPRRDLLLQLRQPGARVGAPVVGDGRLGRVDDVLVAGDEGEVEQADGGGQVRRRPPVRHWLTVRTLWSSFTPWSQIGYQSRSASPVRSPRRGRAVWCSRTRSKSLSGPAVAAGEAARRRRARPRRAGAPRWPRPRARRATAIPKSARAARRAGPAPGAAKLRVPARSSRREVTSSGWSRIGPFARARRSEWALRTGRGGGRPSTGP